MNMIIKWIQTDFSQGFKITLWKHFNSQSHGVMAVVCWIYTKAITPQKWHQGGCFVVTQYHVVQIRKSECIQCMKIEY